MRGDDKALDRRFDTTRRQIEAGALERAAAALKELSRSIETFRIDRAFVQAKLKRLERAIAAAQMTAEDKRRMATVSQRILSLIMEDQLVAASQLMSDTRRQIARLRSQPPF
jgi:hypothetical protein